MDKKVSVSRFLQRARRAPGAKLPPLPRQPPPPPPRPGWPSSGRVSAALLLGLGLFGLGLLIAVGVADNPSPAPSPAPPRHYDAPQSQGPAAWHDTPPTPAPDRTPVKDFRDEFYSERRNAVTVTAVIWSPPSQEFGFTISNANPFPVRDVDIGCRLAAPSGTEMGDAIVTVYEIVPANAQKIVRVLVNEFFEINTYRFSPIFPRQATRIATCSAGSGLYMLDLDGVPVKTDAQLKAWCTRHHRCGL
jgi:hypothetical protein